MNGTTSYRGEGHMSYTDIVAYLNLCDDVNLSQRIIFVLAAGSSEYTEHSPTRLTILSHLANLFWYGIHLSVQFLKLWYCEIVVPWRESSEKFLINNICYTNSQLFWFPSLSVSRLLSRLGFFCKVDMEVHLWQWWSHCLHHLCLHYLHWSTVYHLGAKLLECWWSVPGKEYKKWPLEFQKGC